MGGGSFLFVQIRRRIVFGEGTGDSLRFSWPLVTTGNITYRSQVRFCSPMRNNFSFLDFWFVWGEEAAQILHPKKARKPSWSFGGATNKSALMTYMWKKTSSVIQLGRYVCYWTGDCWRELEPVDKSRDIVRRRPTTQSSQAQCGQDVIQFQNLIVYIFIKNLELRCDWNILNKSSKII